MGTIANYGKAQAVAQEIAAAIDVGDVEVMLVDQISDEERRQLMKEIDKEYEQLANESLAILKRLGQKLHKNDRRDLNRFADIEYSRSSANGIAGFHLGFAAALRLLGRKP